VRADVRALAISCAGEFAFEFYFIATLLMTRRALSRCFDSSDLIDRGGVLCVSEKFLQAFSSGIYNFFTLFLDIYLAVLSPL
jgi:hypothetical protein